MVLSPVMVTVIGVGLLLATGALGVEPGVTVSVQVPPIAIFPQLAGEILLPLGSDGDKE